MKLKLTCILLAFLQPYVEGGWEGTIGGSSRGDIHGGVTYKNDNYAVGLHAGRNPGGSPYVGASFSYSWRRRRGLDGLKVGPIKTLPCEFEIYDRNGDGSCTLKEFEAVLNERHFVDKGSVFKVMDVNADGKVTEEEFLDVAFQVANELLFPECKKDNGKN